jgi:VWFA-related protein
MRRPTSFVAVLGVLCFITAVSARQQPTPKQPPEKSQPEAQQPPVFRTEANFVRVDAYPTKDGRPLQGLTADDFELLEDGKPQKIVSFEHVRIVGGTPPDARIEPNSVREGERMAANPRNRVFVLYLDVAHVEVEGSHHIKEPLIRLMGRLMGPDDLVAVMTPLMTPTQLTFGRRTEVIEQQLRENWPWGKRFSLAPMDEREIDYTNCYPPLSGDRGGQSDLAQEMIDRRRERLVLESLHDLVTYLGGIREERKAILTITDGWQLYRPNPGLQRLRTDPTTGLQDPVPGQEPIGVGPDGRLRRSPHSMNSGGAQKYDCDSDRLALASMDNERYFRDLLELANRWNSSFYPIDPRGLPAVDDPIGPDQPLPPHLSQARLKYKLERLRELAENTDGLAILNSNDLDKGLKRVSDDLTSYYLLGYYSTNPKLDGTFRSLKVRVKTPGVAVRARRGYRAATEADVRNARAAAAVPVPDATTAATNAIAALARVRPDIPFVVRAVAARPDGGDTAAIWISGELQATPGASNAGGSATIQITGEGLSETASAELKSGERAFLIRVPISKALSRADVRARFVPAGPAGTLPYSYSTTVSAPSGLPEPVIFRRGLSTANRQQPAANLVFARSDRVHCEVLIAAGDKPGAGRLLDKAGQASPIPVAISERTDAASGERWMVADLALAALGAGDYVVELSASSAAGGQKKVMTAIRVAR